MLTKGSHKTARLLLHIEFLFSLPFVWRHWVTLDDAVLYASENVKESHSWARDSV